MADAGEDDRLREMAANRGCRLVKSRRRKPGTGDYGRYGLKDARTGAELFGFGKSGLTATGTEIADFLRGGAASEWKRSLGASGKAPPKRRPPPPPPKPEKAAPPPLRVREADAVDAEAIAALLAGLGLAAKADAVADRLALLARAGEPALVARRGDALLGCAAWHVEPSLHRPRPLGRITLLAALPRSGAGQALAEAAEARLRARGCDRIEIARDAKP